MTEAVSEKLLQYLDTWNLKVGCTLVHLIAVNVSV